MKRTVLSIEDTPGIRRLIRMTLEYDGFEVIEAEDGQQGLELARGRKPDLILMDICMPGISGLEACQRLQAEPATAHIPIVMLAAADRSDSMQAAFEVGAKAYFSKPFQPLALIEMVHKVIEESTLQ
jgi:CheY-like chemotaxis protein